jgi:hypothetical protein
MVAYYFGQAGFPDETDYALMVMFGQSRGNPEGGNIPGMKLVGLFGIPEETWGRFSVHARRWWGAKGITIGADPKDPVANIATAAWLRSTEPSADGWGHFAAANAWYRPGAWSAGTFWDGERYQGLGVEPVSPPPRKTTGRPGMSYIKTAQGASSTLLSPLPGVRPGAGGVYGVVRKNPDGTERAHQGIDLSAPLGTPILATAAGRVVEVGQSRGVGGLVVKVDHGNGWVSSYFHIQEGGFKVRVGDTVQAGQQIALVGQTGNAKGPHVHFEIRKNGESFDPWALFNSEPGSKSAVPETPLTHPKTRRDQARAILGGTIDSISRQIASGSRMSLEQVKANRLTTQSDQPQQAVMPNTISDDGEF